MPARVAPATDFTGRKAAEQAKAAKEEQSKRAQEMSLAHATQQVIDENEVVDVTGATPVALEEEEVIDFASEAAALAGDNSGLPTSSAQNLGFLGTEPVLVDEEVIVSNDDDSVVIRVAEDLEEVTIGEKTYNFTAGKKYKVEPNVAFVLRTAGKLYDRL